MANFDLSKLMEGKNPQQVMLAETRELRGKWEQNFEGLGEREQSQISVLLETTKHRLMSYSNQHFVQKNGVVPSFGKKDFCEISSKEFVKVAQ